MDGWVEELERALFMNDDLFFSSEYTEALFFRSRFTQNCPFSLGWVGLALGALFFFT